VLQPLLTARADRSWRPDAGGSQRAANRCACAGLERLKHGGRPDTWRCAAAGRSGIGAAWRSGDATRRQRKSSGASARARQAGLRRRPMLLIAALLAKAMCSAGRRSGGGAAGEACRTRAAQPGHGGRASWRSPTRKALVAEFERADSSSILEIFRRSPPSRRLDEREGAADAAPRA
jgi:hypothetical protein